MFTFRSATAGTVHLLASFFVAACCALLVFWLWYPFPYSQLAGGQELFFLVVAVDVICGPLLTFLIYDPVKSKRELFFDVAVIVFIQVVALCYGLYSVAQARPVFLAFEFDQFRVVSIPDVRVDDIDLASENLRNFSLTGPVFIGVRLASPSDNDFLESIRLTLNGVPPAFRPDRWVSFDSQSRSVVEKAKPLAELRVKYPNAQSIIDEGVLSVGFTEEGLGYLPLSAGANSSWVVVVSLADGLPRLYLPLDGW